MRQGGKSDTSSTSVLPEVQWKYLGVPGSTMEVFGSIMGVPWEYDGSTTGVRREYLGVPWKYLGVSWEYHGSTMGVGWEYHGSTMGVQWEWEHSYFRFFPLDSDTQKKSF